MRDRTYGDETAMQGARGNLDSWRICRRFRIEIRGIRAAGVVNLGNESEGLFG
jgi:hypothetical protein